MSRSKATIPKTTLIKSDALERILFKILVHDFGS